jgi:hypothetical protein
MPFWDFFEDELLIVGAYCHHYGKSVNEFYAMDYYEFYMLLPEIMSSETAFANTIRLRTETNRDRIKNFTPQQKEEYDKWQKRARKWDEKESKKIALWREQHKDQIEAKQKEIEEKKKIAAERLQKMLNKS